VNRELYFEIFECSFQMTETVARTALLGHVKSHCCWGAGAARNMTVVGIRHDCAYHVWTAKLELFLHSLEKP